MQLIRSSFTSKCVAQLTRKNKLGIDEMMVLMMTTTNDNNYYGDVNSHCYQNHRDNGLIKFILKFIYFFMDIYKLLYHS